MTQLIEQVGGWIEELIAAIGYPGIVLVMAIENIFPPIPSEAVLPFAGSLSAKGELDFWGAVAAGNGGFVARGGSALRDWVFRAGGRSSSAGGELREVCFYL